MKLYYDRKSKDPTYWVQKGFRFGGKSTTKNIHKIGKHSELLKEHADPMAYAREVVREYTIKDNNGELDHETVTVSTKENVKASNEDVSKSLTRNVGYIYLQDIYHQLNLDKFFKEITKDRKMTFNCNDINRFLTFARILDPRSKYGTADHLDFYYEEPNFKYQHILRFMDVLNDHYNEYLKYLFKESNNVVKRNTTVCYYDCTNYYFETEKEKEEYIDEITGEEITPYGRYGIGKQHQPSPLVEMGLFMDSDGIPLTMCIHPGNTNEQKTAIPCEKELIKMLDNKKIIYCADAGLGSKDIRNFNDKGGRAYIVTQSIKKLPETLKEAVFNDIDYKLLSDDTPNTLKFMKEFNREEEANLKYYNDCVYKVIDAPLEIDIGLSTSKGSRRVKDKATIKQRIIVTYSRKSAEYQKTIRDRQIERAKSMLENRDPEKIKKGNNDVRRFLKNTGEYKYELDQAVIDEEAKYDGFYALVTNLDDKPQEIIKINSNRYKIEDCFRTLKTYFSARPINHQLNSRIRAHFMICYTALLIYRLLEKKLKLKQYHYPIEKVLETLKNMNVFIQKSEYCFATYTGGNICNSLEDTFGYTLNKEFHYDKEFRKMFKKISK